MTHISFLIMGKNQVLIFEILKKLGLESSFSAGLRPQNNLNKMGFIQKCSKCPKEYVEYETKKDNIYLCYVCR